MNLSQIAGQFSFKGDCLDIKPFGNGHINDTFAVECKTAEGVLRYILQRLNRRVFPNPKCLMDNMSAITEFLRDKIIAEGGDPDRECLCIVRTVDDKIYYVDDNADVWRATKFIENTQTYLVAEDGDMFADAGRAFGQMLSRLADFDASKLYDVIPNFHNTKARYDTLLKAAEADKVGRLKDARQEYDFAQAHSYLCPIIVDALSSSAIPLRVTHNDTKLNNVLIDATTKRAVCVIDLDTVMSGSLLYDFGDAIRVGCSTAEEDEKDLSKVGFNIENFDAFTRGYISGAGKSITKAEFELMPISAVIMTYECGMRFLTDYLDGDNYFKTAYPEHNLVRCRTQFKQARLMLERIEEMKNIVRKYS
ncbi:MAG: aminoglycoside phosphotransferase family protein [Clostridia bacterium]|nr:aminoglycoside phosphotransferase family protein [Clostridia bacterium]